MLKLGTLRSIVKPLDRLRIKLSIYLEREISREIFQNQYGVHELFNIFSVGLHRSIQTKRSKWGGLFIFSKKNRAPCEGL